MENSKECLIEALKKYDDVSRVINDINTIQKMIDEEEYNKEKLIEMESRYSIDTRFLLNFSNKDNIGFEIDFQKPIHQLLINLQNRLYIIAVYRVIKMQGREIPKDIVTSDFEKLIEFLECK